MPATVVPVGIFVILQNQHAAAALAPMLTGRMIQIADSAVHYVQLIAQGERVLAQAAILI